MEKICCDVTASLSQMCFVIHSMQRIFASGAAARSIEELEVAADLLEKLSDESLNAMRKIV